MSLSEYSFSDLNELQGQLSAWRGRQRGRTRLPEAVWAAAATQARSHGVSVVSRKLRLDYYKLSRLAAQPMSPSSKRTPVPTFVELALSSPEIHSERTRGYLVELEGGGGNRMSVDVGGDVSALVALAQALWSRGS